ncbi:type-F conjugative transfer system protein TraW [Pseudomonadota bacterium]
MLKIKTTGIYNRFLTKTEGDSDILKTRIITTHNNLSNKFNECVRHIVNTRRNTTNTIIPCVPHRFLSISKNVSGIWETFIACIILSFILLYPVTSHSADLGTHGTTYEIQEQDLIEYIKSKLKVMGASGELQRKQQEIKKQTIERAKRPKPVEGITNATEYKEYTYDPTFILDKDIKDSTGKILFTKGTKVNPLDTLPFTKTLIFLDGDNKKQVEWALEQYQLSQNDSKQIDRIKLILINGSPIELMEKHKIRFYFDQSGYLIKKLNIKHVPAILQQKGRELLIKEIPMKEDKKENETN